MDDGSCSRRPMRMMTHMTVLAIAALVMFVTGSVLIGWWARDWRQATRSAQQTPTHHGS